MTPNVHIGSPTCPTISFMPEHAEIAVAWVKTLVGLLAPERFLEVVNALSPEHAESAAVLLKVCFGAGA